MNEKKNDQNWTPQNEWNAHDYQIAKEEKNYASLPVSYRRKIEFWQAEAHLTWCVQEHKLG